MRRRRIALTAVVASLFGVALVPGAQARPWAADYPWQADATVGYEGWAVFDTDPDGGPDSDWYRSFLGGSPFGRGLAAQPLGGQLYSSPSPERFDAGPRLRFVWSTPGNSRITSATFREGVLSNQPSEGQYLRARVYSAANPTDGTRDFGDARGNPERTTPYTNLTATVSNGADATQAEGWLFTTCPSSATTPGTYDCPTIPTDTDSYGRWGDIRIQLDDPDDPNVDVTSDPPITTGWTNKRRAQRFTITGRDGSSGIARIRAQVQVGASTRTFADRTVACDPDHRTAGRRGLVCPDEASAAATDPGRDSSSRDRRYTLTAVDYAGNTGTRTFTLRRDLVAPASAKLTGELIDLTRTWTNRVGDVSATVRAADRLSGVAKIEITAQRQVGGRTTVLATAAPDCDDGCRTVTERMRPMLDATTLPRDGRYRLGVRVTDRAGNIKTFRAGAPLRVDRTAPQRVGPDPVYRVLRGGVVRVLFSPGRDPQPGSGLERFVLRYSVPGSSQPRFFRATPRQTVTSSRGELRFRKSRSRVITFRIPRGELDTDKPVELAQLDRARGTEADARTDGEAGNALFQDVRYVARANAGAVAWEVFGAIEDVFKLAKATAGGIALGYLSTVIEDSFEKSFKATSKIDPDNLPQCNPVTQCGQIRDDALKLYKQGKRAMVTFNASFALGKTLTPGELDRTVGRLGDRLNEDFIPQVERFRDRRRRDTESGIIGAGTQAGVANDLLGNLRKLSSSLASVGAVGAVLAAEATNPDTRRNRKGVDCWKKGAVFREFTDAQKRWNLCVITKRKAIYLATRKSKNGFVQRAYEAHHIFPRKAALARQFAQAAIPNVNYPFFLCWQGIDQHRRSARAYNQEWAKRLAQIRGTRATLLPRDRGRVLQAGFEFALGRGNVPKGDFSCRTSFTPKSGGVVGAVLQKATRVDDTLP